jgi:sodium transport system permease protein
VKFRQVWSVIKKELLSAARDRRTQLAILILPVVFVPLVSLTLIQSPSIHSRTLQERSVTVAIQVDEDAFLDELMAALALVKVTVIPTSSPIASMERGEADLAVVVSINDVSNRNVEVWLKSSRRESVVAYERIRTVVDNLAAVLLETRVREVGLPASLARPLTLHTHDLAGENGFLTTVVSSLLVLLVCLWPGISSMQTAIDTGAGERERGTLEALLTTAIHPQSLVLGKMTCVFVNAFVGGLISLGVGVAALRIAASKVDVAHLPVGGNVIAQMTLIVGLVSLFISALGLLISVVSRSTKEAQTYLAPFNLLVMVPIVLAETWNANTVHLGMYAVPVLNYVILVKEAASGSLSPLPVGITVLSIVVYASLMGYITYYCLTREGAVSRA